MFKRDFTNTFLDSIQPGHHILDFGAGQGEFSDKFVERGAHVTAVDTHIPDIKDPMITVKRMKVEDFCMSGEPGPFNMIFARNIIQFLEKPWVLETLFPWMEEHLAPEGIVAIQTFYRDPEPPFEQPMRSLYTLEELTNQFRLWTELFANQGSHHGYDMSGQLRRFFVTGLIVKRRA